MKFILLFTTFLAAFPLFAQSWSAETNGDGKDILINWPIDPHRGSTLSERDYRFAIGMMCDATMIIAFDHKHGFRKGREIPVRLQMLNKLGHIPEDDGFVPITDTDERFAEETYQARVTSSTLLQIDNMTWIKNLLPSNDWLLVEVNLRGTKLQRYFFGYAYYNAYMKACD